MSRGVRFRCLRPSPSARIPLRSARRTAAVTPDLLFMFANVPVQSSGCILTTVHSTCSRCLLLEHVRLRKSCSVPCNFPFGHVGRPELHSYFLARFFGCHVLQCRATLKRKDEVTVGSAILKHRAASREQVVFMAVERVIPTKCFLPGLPTCERSTRSRGSILAIRAIRGLGYARGGSNTSNRRRSATRR